VAKVTAISSLGWAHYTLYEALPRMARRGFTRVEIASFLSYCFHFNFGSPTPPELRTMMADLGLSPICLNFFFRPYEAWRAEEIEPFVRDIGRKVEQLGEAGIPMMTLSFGWKNDRPDRTLQLGHAVTAYNRLGKVAERCGVRLLLEVPHMYSILRGTEEALWVFERVESDHVGALVDTTHWYGTGYDLDSFLAALGKRLWHVHLRDAGPSHENPKELDLELTPGRGRVDFRRFGQALDRLGYAGDVSLEFEYRDVTLPGIEEEYDYGIRHLRNCGWDFPAGVKPLTGA
jgi:sugar phosphate isomerase/epimerase